ncbi:MAG: DoxX family protein [Caldilineaceae bacterium]
MEIILWILQILLAAVFLAHGLFMVAPPAEYAVIINAELGRAFSLFIGIAEVLAALALIVPGLARRLTWLTPLAAAGLMIVMVSATALHGYRGEGSSAITTAVLLVLVTFVAYMRWKVRPLVRIFSPAQTA